MFSTLARIGLGLAAMVLASTTLAPAETSATPAQNVIAQASPSPPAAPTPTPNPLTYRGYVRAYDFTRQNASSYNKTGTTNQQTFAAALSLHGQYVFSPSGLIVGGTYLYSTPFNGCPNPASHFTPPCGNNKAPSLNPDDTLPGFALNTLYEAYLAYQAKNWAAKIGNQLTTPATNPWATTSDSRLKPSSYQGVDAIYHFSKALTFEGAFYNRFEERVSSNFFNNTLLTGQYADGSGISTLYNTNIKSSAASPASLTNAGMWFGRVGYNTSHLTANAEFYSWSNILNMGWLQGSYTFALPFKPFVAAQIGYQRNVGSALVGQINSQVYGLQGGVSIGPNFVFAISGDYVPPKTADITLPAGGVCPSVTGNGANAHVLKANAGLADYFLGTGGTPNCVPGPSVNGLNTATVYYGGIASPYTDSYATDPLFTTSISQGMADRRSFGWSGKVQGTYTTSNKKLIVYISRALYAYGNTAVGVSPTQEDDIDGQYFFNPVPKTGLYKGFMVRYRYAERTINNTTVYGGTPLFKYNRAQFEYDF